MNRRCGWRDRNKRSKFAEDRPAPADGAHEQHDGGHTEEFTLQPVSDSTWVLRRLFIWSRQNPSGREIAPRCSHAEIGICKPKCWLYC